MMCESKMIMKGSKNKPAACLQEFLVYLISCDECAKDNMQAHYYGESSRTGFQHGQENLAGQAKQLEENALSKYDLIHHGGKPGSYSMRSIRTHKSALSLQVHEATEIQHSNANIQLNSKNEFNGP